jgi:hypothetical protein
MKILLVSEGRHELALGDPECALGELVRRCLDRELEFERQKVSDAVVRTHQNKGKSLNYEKRVLGWVKYAQKMGYDALVLVIDRDRTPDREAGITSAQANTLLALPRALGVAVEAFDAWMLADERALSSAFGQVVNRQRDPEKLAAPKVDFRQLIEDLQPPISQTELYFTIAKWVEIEELIRRCPRGFKPFFDRLQLL